MTENKINRPVILGIVGDSAAGKTTITKAIKKILGEDKVTCFCTDDYHIYDREERKQNKTEALDPDCNYLDILEQHLLALKEGKPILKPIYNHGSGKLERPEYLRPKPYIITEGLLGYYTREMRNCYDVKIYLEPEEEVRRQWKIKRDTTQRGYSEAEVIKQLDNRVSLSKEIISPQSLFADMVVSFVRGNHEHLDVKIIMRPTLPHPDLSPSLSKANEEEINLKLARDSNNKPVDILRLSGCLSDQNAEIIEKLIWNSMPEISHLGDRAKDFMGSDFINHPLLLSQLIICYHMVKAAQGVSVL